MMDDRQGRSMFAGLFMGDSGSTKWQWMDGWLVGSMGVAALAISTMYCGVCRMPRWPTYHSHIVCSSAVLVHVMLTQTRSHLSVSEPLIVCFSIIIVTNTFTGFVEISTHNKPIKNITSRVTTGVLTSSCFPDTISDYQFLGKRHGKTCHCNQFYYIMPRIIYNISVPIYIYPVHIIIKIYYSLKSLMVCFWF